jgi:hypothetical protein
MLTTYLAFAGLAIGCLILIAYPIARLLHHLIVSHQENQAREAARAEYDQRRAHANNGRYRAF